MSSMTTATVTPAPVTPPEYKRCPELCYGGNRCVCNSLVAHEMHCCGNAACQCHSREYLDSVREVKK